MDKPTLMFSLAICTRDGADRLPDLFTALRALIVPADTSVEIIVVNNASRDATVAVAQRELAQFTIPSCIVTENESGLVFARDAAARAACGQWLAFLDDDNLPATDWLVQIAAAVRSGGDRLGAFSGEVRPRWLVPPPSGIDRVENFLGCHKAGPAPFRYAAERGIVPPGAGLVVRREAWLAAVPLPGQLFFTGRISGHLLGGEDIECLTHLHRAGWEIWHFPAMLIHHVMPPARVKLDYLKNLCRAGGLVRHHLRMMRTRTAMRPLVATVYLTLDAARLAYHVARHPRMRGSNIVAQCRREYLVGTLMSPNFLYRWKGQSVSPVRAGQASGSWGAPSKGQADR